MSDHHHDHSHSTEKKPVSFTVPFILASVFILAMVLFLSLCDPKPHHGECEEKCTKECADSAKCKHDEHGVAKTEESHSDSDTEEAKSEPAAASAESAPEAKAEEAHH